MKSSEYSFNDDHLQNIKQIFMEKSGVQLTKNKAILPRYQFAAITLAAILFLSIGTPVLAANVPAAYEFLYLVSPEMAQFFMPVHKSDEDNGIRMEVVSAYIHGSTAEIYVTLQDLTGNRIDETTDLFDSYSINRPFDSSASCSLVGYDEGTRTATFFITITAMKDQKIIGDKITFSVREFLSHKESYSDVKLPIDLIKDAIVKETQEVYSTGGGGQDYRAYTRDGAATVLKPSKALSSFPIPGINVTAIGFIDQKLHVQVALGNRLNNDNHGSVYLKNEAGEMQNYNSNVYFTNQYGDQQDRIDYCEYVFDIPENELASYSLFGDFDTSGMNTKGYWSVTFPLESKE